ncbi:MAG: hypothetical protein H0W54_03620 [Rubrobacter sp.]|nr:hypothetical protein [Rubrobacter sp.]
MTDRQTIVEARFGGSVRLARPPVKEPTVTRSEGLRSVDGIAGSVWRGVL